MLNERVVGGVGEEGEAAGRARAGIGREVTKPFFNISAVSFCTIHPFGPRFY